MTDMAAQTQPRPIPGSNALQPPATNLAIPKSVQSLRPNYGLSVDTSSPVTQNGSYEFDRIIKSGEVLKRTRKTKVRVHSDDDSRGVDCVLMYFHDSPGSPYT